jgi:hypothetical protein
MHLYSFEFDCEAHRSVYSILNIARQTMEELVCPPESLLPYVLGSLAYPTQDQIRPSLASSD